MEPMQFGPSVRRLRLQLGMTQRELAHAVGPYLDERDISRIESGRRGLLPPDLLVRLLEALGMERESFRYWSLPGSATAQQASSSSSIQAERAPGARRPAMSDFQLALNRLHRARNASEQVCFQSSQIMSRSRQLTQAWN